jgi:hypothetical protein
MRSISLTIPDSLLPAVIFLHVKASSRMSGRADHAGHADTRCFVMFFTGIQQRTIKDRLTIIIKKRSMCIVIAMRSISLAIPDSQLELCFGRSRLAPAERSMSLKYLRPEERSIQYREMLPFRPAVRRFRRHPFVSSSPVCCLRSIVRARTVDRTGPQG